LVTESRDRSAALNLGNLQSGVYILSTGVDGELYSQSFVKQ